MILTFYDTLFQETLISSKEEGIIILKLQFDVPFET